MLRLKPSKRRDLDGYWGYHKLVQKSKKKKYREIAETTMKDEMDRQMIIGEIKERGPLTIKELSEATKIPPKQILRHILALRKQGIVSEAGEKEDWYLYKVK